MAKIILEEQASADTPATNKVAVYAKAGGGIHKKNDAGTEKQLVEAGADSLITSLGALSGQQTIPTINLTGGQIAFPATAVPSADPNTLDDYEEGTWSLGLVAITSGTITLNTSYDTMSYVKNGRSVDIFGNPVVSSVSSPVGALALTNLPFACVNLQDTAEATGFAIMYTGVLAIGAPGALYGRVLATATQIEIWEVTTTNWLNDVANHMQGGSEFYITFTYPVA